MPWMQRIDRIAGAIFLLLIVGLILGFAFAQTPDSSRDDIAGDLQDLADDNELYLFGMAVQVVIGILLTVLGAALYALFRGRDRFLPLLGLTSFLGFGILFVASAAAYVPLETLAGDLQEGGAGGAGEAEILELARILTEVGDGLFFLAIYFLAVGLIGFGLTIARAPLGVTTDLGPAAAGAAPPRWMGWVAFAAGVGYIASVLFVIAEFFFVFALIGFVLTLAWYISMGVWLTFMSRAARYEVEPGPNAV